MAQGFNDPITPEQETAMIKALALIEDESQPKDKWGRISLTPLLELLSPVFPKEWISLALIEVLDLNDMDEKRRAYSWAQWEDFWKGKE